MSQSDTWLLICGRVKANECLLQKQHFYCSPAMLKSSKFPKNGSGVKLNFFPNYFKGLAVFSVHKKHFLPSKKCGENFNTMPESFL